MQHETNSDPAVAPSVVALVRAGTGKILSVLPMCPTHAAEFEDHLAREEGDLSAAGEEAVWLTTDRCAELPRKLRRQLSNCAGCANPAEWERITTKAPAPQKGAEE